MKFLIQTVKKKIVHDFSFELINAINFNNWLYNSKAFKYCLTDEKTKEGYCPIGSVEFVSKYLFDYYGLIPTPRNIPEELMGVDFTCRNVIDGTEENIDGYKFIKSNDKIKTIAKFGSSAPEGNYQISDILDIQSEWRSFIYQGKLVGLQNYSGEFDMFPDVNKIKEMILTYKSAPVAYTLDVAVLENGLTAIIEVHDFFSIGLYGFSEYKILPFMFYRWFNNYTREKK